MPERNPPPFDPRRLVRRALEAAGSLGAPGIEKPDDLDRVLDRMERDDASFGPDSLDPDSSDLPLSDESGFGSSRMGGDASDDSSQGGTLREQEAPVDSTIELQITGESEEPSLSDAYPSSKPGRSTSRLTILATPRYRPTRRPPMAVLRVFDDDQRDFQSIRIRQTPFVIGRQDGDFVVGHERQMSRRHARIDRVQEGEAYRWHLADLRSTNGTFVRVPKVTLEDGLEVLLAGELVRFVETPSSEGPELVRVAPQAEEERFRLTPGVHLIGTDSACIPFLRSSPFLDPQHLRLEQVKGRWTLVDLQSANHLWVAISKRTELTSGSEFQIGEQRFSLHLP